MRVSDIYTYFTDQPDAFHADMARVFTLMQDGVLKPQVSTMPLSAASEAHRQLEGGATTGKLVLTIE